MADYPAMPLWTDAYLADTGHLTDEQHGLYLRLLMLLWRSPGCRFPNNPVLLAHKLGRPAEFVDSVVTPLIEEFCTVRRGWITQKRLTREYDGVRARSKTQAEKARSRWERKKSNAAAVPPAGAQHESGNTSLPIPIPIPIPIPTKANPLPPSPDTARDVAAEFIAIFDAERVKAFGAAQARAHPTAKDYATAPRWCEAGGTPELVASVLRARMAAWKSDTGDLPKSLAVFSDSVLAAIAEVKKPLQLPQFLARPQPPRQPMPQVEDVYAAMGLGSTRKDAQ